MSKFLIYNKFEENLLFYSDDVILTSNNRIIESIYGAYDGDVKGSYKIGNRLKFLTNKNKHKYIFKRNSFLLNDNYHLKKDSPFLKDNMYIYEYDLIKVVNRNEKSHFTGVVNFKKGCFYVSHIYEVEKRKKHKEILLKDIIELKDHYFVVLGSILKIKDNYRFVRNRFYFKVPDTTIEYGMNKEEKLYKIIGNTMISTDEKAVLSTDCYDINEELIYECDKLLVSIDGTVYKGEVSELIDGYYPIKIREDYFICLNNELNEKKYDYIKLDKS